MCGPAAVAGAALSVGGTMLQQSAASSAAKAQQGALNRQTQLSAKEFDKRMALASGSDTRSTELTKAGSKERRDLEVNTQRDVSAGYEAQTGRDSASTDTYYGELANILSQQSGELGTARSDYNATADAARAKQAGFRQQADTRVDQLVGGSGFDASQADRAAAAGKRSAIGNLATSLVEVPGHSTPMLYAGAPDNVRAELARASAVADTRAGRSNDSQANILAYADAGKEGNRRISQAREDLAGIDMKSQAEAANTPYQLAPSKLAYGNANDRAIDARNTASSGLEGKLKMSAAELASSTIPLKQYADKIDQALADYYHSRLSSESEYATGTIGSSQNFEDQNRALTNYKIAGTTGSSPIGDLMAGFGSSMMSGGGGPSWSQVGSMARDPFGVVGPMGPTLPSTQLGKLVF